MTSHLVPNTAVAEWRPRLPEGWMVRGFTISRSRDWGPDRAEIELVHISGWAVRLEYLWPVAPDATGLFEFLDLLGRQHGTHAVRVDASWDGYR